MLKLESSNDFLVNLKMTFYEGGQSRIEKRKAIPYSEAIHLAVMARLPHDMMDAIPKVEITPLTTY